MAHITRILPLALAFLAFPHAVSAQEQAPDAAKASGPKMVTYDFESEIKTTVLKDGNVIEETFDPKALRRIAGRPGKRSVTSMND